MKKHKLAYEKSLYIVVLLIFLLLFHLFAMTIVCSNFLAWKPAMQRIQVYHGISLSRDISYVMGYSYSVIPSNYVIML